MPLTTPPLIATSRKPTVQKAACAALAVITAQYTVGPFLQDCFLHGAAVGHFYDLNVYQAGGRTVLDGTALYDGSFPVQGMTLPFTYPPLTAGYYLLFNSTESRFTPAWIAIFSARGAATACAARVLHAPLVQRDTHPHRLGLQGDAKCIPHPIAHSPC